MSLNEIQTSGFWIVYANSATRKFIDYSVVCRSLREKLGEQKWQNCHLIDSKMNPHSLIVGSICLVLSLSAANERN